MRLEQNGIYKALTRAADGVIVVDANSRILLWNRAAERVLGWSAAEAVGRTCCEVFEGRQPTDWVCRNGCSVAAAAHQVAPVESFDMRTRTKTGREVRLNVSTLAVPPESGASALIIHLFRDVTSCADAPAHGGVVNGGAANGAPANGSASGATHAAGADGAGPLTPRELEVLRLLAGGANTRIAAGHLRVSPATIRNHVQNLMGKLGVHSRLQAVAYANTHGLV